MEGRRMTTRSSRRATALPASPVKQAVMASVMRGGKAPAKRSTRKVLADKTNATPVSGVVASKSVNKASLAGEARVKEEVSTPRGKVEHVPGTTVPRGEDLLRSLVHSNLSIVQTPTGLASQCPEAETPQFGVPLSSYQDKEEEAAAVIDVGEEVIETRHVIAERLSSAWVAGDVDGVTEVGDDDDSDCSKLVNVSSPGMNLRVVGSPAPAAIHPTTPRTADVKWQRRESQKVKKSEGECGFNYYEYEVEDYEGCDEYNGEGFAKVIDCDDICQGISRIKVGEGLPEYKGRHYRFNYNSDDEIDVEEVDVMRLRGLPTPRGKHLRFKEDNEESSP